MAAASNAPTGDQVRQLEAVRRIVCADLERTAWLVEENPAWRDRLWPRFAGLATQHDQLCLVLDGRLTLDTVRHLLVS